MAFPCKSYLKFVGNISTAKALTGPIPRPIIGNDDRSTANNISCLMTLMRVQNIPMRKNTMIRSLFLPMNLTVLLTATAITAQLTLATELIMNVIESIVSTHTASSATV